MCPWLYKPKYQLNSDVDQSPIWNEGYDVDDIQYTRCNKTKHCATTTLLQCSYNNFWPSQTKHRRKRLWSQSRPKNWRLQIRQKMPIADKLLLTDVYDCSNEAHAAAAAAGKPITPNSSIYSKLRPALWRWTLCNIIINMQLYVNNNICCIIMTGKVTQRMPR